MDNGLCQGLAQLVMYLCKPVTGIEPTGNMVKQPAKFTVDTISAGQGDVMVFVEDPEGNKEEVCGWMLPPQAVSHEAFGAYNRDSDCASIFLIKAHTKIFCTKRISRLTVVKVICPRAVL